MHHNWILSAEQAHALLGSAGVCLLDVREPEECSLLQFDVADIQYFPVSQMPAQCPAWTEHSTWIVACAHGIRSTMVVQYFRQQGIANVFGLKGGIEEWKRMGFAVQQ